LIDAYPGSVKEKWMKKKKSNPNCAALPATRFYRIAQEKTVPASTGEEARL